MPERCVAALCDNVNDPENNTSLHRIPFFGETCPIKQRRRETKPVGKLRPRKKKELGAGKNLFAVFNAQKMTSLGPPNLGVVKMKRELKRDEVGVCVFPSRHISRENCDEEVPSKRSRGQRMVSHLACRFYYFIAPVFLTSFCNFFVRFYFLSCCYFGLFS